MKWIIILITLISVESQAKCPHTILIRVDNSFSLNEKSEIKKAIVEWYMASNRKICFELIYQNIGDESKTYFEDKFNTIYNAESGWGKKLALKYNCEYKKEKCMGITFGGKHLKSDVFITEKYKFFSIVLHEIGHVIGLPHSDDIDDAMHVKVRKNIVITDRDKIVLKCIMDKNKVNGWIKSCSYLKENDYDKK